VYTGVKRELGGDMPLMKCRPTTWTFSEIRENDPTLDRLAMGRVILALAASESIRSLRALAASLLDRDMEAGMAARR
jgi:hypothetical protein